MGAGNDRGTTTGSVLGPVLLNTFISDLEEVKEHALMCFADDTKPQEKSRYTQEHPEGLNTLEEWTNRNLMEIREEKCQALHLGRKNLSQQRRLTAWGAALWIRTKSLGRQQAEQGPAVCPGSSGGQQPPGLY